MNEGDVKKQFTEVYKELVMENIIDKIFTSGKHIDEVYKSLNREELHIFSEECRRLSDMETYEKLINLMINRR